MDLLDKKVGMHALRNAENVIQFLEDPQTTLHSTPCLSDTSTTVAQVSFSSASHCSLTRCGSQLHLAIEREHPVVIPHICITTGCSTARCSCEPHRVNLQCEESRTQPMLHWFTGSTGNMH